ncbi:hypothetical protein AB1N83_008266 [Pleurotus pulmonarius]
MHERGAETTDEVVKVVGGTGSWSWCRPRAANNTVNVYADDISTLSPTLRVALRSDSYTLHKILSNDSRPACTAYDGREGARQHIRDVWRCFMSSSMSSLISAICLSNPGALRRPRYRATERRAALRSPCLSMSAGASSCRSTSEREVASFESFFVMLARRLGGAADDVGAAEPMKSIKERRQHVMQEEFEFAVAQVLKKKIREGSTSVNKLFS